MVVWQYAELVKKVFDGRVLRGGDSGLRSDDLRIEHCRGGAYVCRIEIKVLTGLAQAVIVTKRKTDDRPKTKPRVVLVDWLVPNLMEHVKRLLLTDKRRGSEVERVWVTRAGWEVGARSQVKVHEPDVLEKVFRVWPRKEGLAAVDLLPVERGYSNLRQGVRRMLQPFSMDGNENSVPQQSIDVRLHPICLKEML